MDPMPCAAEVERVARDVDALLDRLRLLRHVQLSTNRPADMDPAIGHAERVQRALSGPRGQRDPAPRAPDRRRTERRTGQGARTGRARDLVRRCGTCDIRKTSQWRRARGLAHGWVCNRCYVNERRCAAAPPHRKRGLPGAIDGDQFVVKQIGHMNDDGTYLVYWEDSVVTPLEANELNRSDLNSQVACVLPHPTRADRHLVQWMPTFEPEENLRGNQLFETEIAQRARRVAH
jgi:hypothetical protein